MGEDDNEKRREQLINKEIVISKAREILGKKGSARKPRSVASLLRLFVCKGGFPPTVPEPRNSLPQSRMEKVTRRPLDWKLDEREINECLEDALRDLDEDGAKWLLCLKCKGGDSICSFRRGSKGLGKLGGVRGNDK
ncbi:hypothetical protein EJB05_43204 [Eragrostis curvula]|uniref:Uncharacterized protein n=1 Tax=Eragrostis curvula TaxID=38414 RepID=A0A5J9TEJ5_9POAL|nr:hypothetical protein EJB05_43204 [Eragrostis curvula]